jgi:hypothetical protein
MVLETMRLVLSLESRTPLVDVVSEGGWLLE